MPGSRGAGQILCCSVAVTLRGAAMGYIVSTVFWAAIIMFTVMFSLMLIKEALIPATG